METSPRTSEHSSTGTEKCSLTALDCVGIGVIALLGALALPTAFYYGQRVREILGDTSPVVHHPPYLEGPSK